MSVVVSGTLKSPDGEAISGANITLTALTVSPDALSGTSASAVTDAGAGGVCGFCDGEREDCCLRTCAY